MICKTSKIKKIIAILSCGLLGSLMGGCASIVSGSDENISVNTMPVDGARCVATNNRGSWHVVDSPGNVMVKRSGSPLNFNCKTDDGYVGHATLSSTLQPMTVGNVVFGGVIGAGVDLATGAFYEYPTSVTVPMRQSNNTVKKSYVKSGSVNKESKKA